MRKVADHIKEDQKKIAKAKRKGIDLRSLRGLIRSAEHRGEDCFFLFEQVRCSKTTLIHKIADVLVECKDRWLIKRRKK